MKHLSSSIDALVTRIVLYERGQGATKEVITLKAAIEHPLDITGFVDLSEVSEKALSIHSWHCNRHLAANL